MSVALLQGNIAQEMKFRPERYARILETYARLAEDSKAQLIVLPETAVPRFYDAVDPGYLADESGVKPADADPHHSSPLPGCQCAAPAARRHSSYVQRRRALTLSRSGVASLSDACGADAA